jgi:two-component system OmpR family sensor kinase
MRRWLVVVLILTPALVGGTAFAAMHTGLLPNFVWMGTVVVDVSALSLWIGILVSLLLVGSYGWRVQQRCQRQQIRHTATVEQQAERRRFLRRLDHELKNPLLIIRLAAENLHQSSLSLPKEQAESLARLVQQSQRLQKLVEGLRLLTDLGEAQLEREPVALADVLAEAIALFDDPQTVAPWVTLRMQQVPWPVGAIQGDRDLLVMAFHNLLENARKFGGDSAMVEVRASEDGGMAVVEIADTGVGIPPDEISHVFGELYRAQNARGVPGSGLGLVLVQRIVELHGGAIGVRSRLDQGTVVSVRLPLA